MRTAHLWLGGLALGALLLVSGPFRLAPWSGQAAASLTEAPSPREQTAQLAELINRVRVEAGIPPLARSPELDQAASAHSRDMAEHDFLEHEGSDGSTPQQRAARAGDRVPEQSGWLVVELISAISEQPEGPLNWWLKESPATHGRHLLDPRYREMGLGYASGGTYGNYWTVLLGCRPGVLPTVEFEGQSYKLDERCSDAPVPTTTPAASPTRTPTPTVTATANASPTATPSPRPATSLRVSDLVVSPGSWATVRWQGISNPTATDWIGLYQAGDPDSTYTSWFYVDCSRAPASPVPAGACEFLVVPSASPGTYELRLFAQNSTTRLARSESFRVRPP